jgi:hypothetical protein
VSELAQALNGVTVPGKVVADNFQTAGVYVGKGNICRIECTAAVYIAFGDSSIGAVSITTTPALKLVPKALLESMFYHVIAADDYIRCDAFASIGRLEVINV